MYDQNALHSTPLHSYQEKKYMPYSTYDFVHTKLRVYPNGTCLHSTCRYQFISSGMIGVNLAATYMKEEINHWPAPALVLIRIFETKTCKFHPLHSFSSTHPKSWVIFK